MLHSFLNEVDEHGQPRRAKLRKQYEKRLETPQRKAPTFASAWERRKFEAERTPMRPFTINLAEKIGPEPVSHFFFLDYFNSDSI